MIGHQEQFVLFYCGGRCSKQYRRSQTLINQYVKELNRGELILVTLVVSTTRTKPINMTAKLCALHTAKLCEEEIYRARAFYFFLAQLRGAARTTVQRKQHASW